MTPARIARVIEIYLYGALLGVLVAVVLVRFSLLFLEIQTPALIGALIAGAAAGLWVGYARQRDRAAIVAALRARSSSFRAVCLKTMLWLLAIATAVGVLAVLTASYDLLGRISGTLAATALAAALLWPLSALLEKPKSLAAGIFGILMTMVVYCLAMPLIWEYGYRQEELLLSSLVLGLSAPFGMAAIRMTEMSKTRLSGRIGTLLYAIVLACFLTASWHSNKWGGDEHWWLFGWYLAGFGSLAVACLVGLRPRLQFDWRWLGVAISAFGWAVIVLQEWGPLPWYEKGNILLVSVACGFAYVAVSLLVPLTSSQKWLRWVTIGAVVVTIVFLNLESLLAPNRDISFLGRVAGAAAVVTSCGSLALLVLLRLNTQVAVVEPNAEVTSVVLYCPGCGKKQTMALSGDQCRHCGLRINIAVEHAGVERTRE